MTERHDWSDFFVANRRPAGRRRQARCLLKLFPGDQLQGRSFLDVGWAAGYLNAQPDPGARLIASPMLGQGIVTVQTSTLRRRAGTERLFNVRNDQ
jgi:hypothetical protein